MAYKKCPGCGGQLLFNVPLCGECGFKFPVVQQAPAAPQQQTCSNCGCCDAVTETACRKCGYYFASSSSPSVMPRLSDPGWEIPVEDAPANYTSVIAMWLTTIAAGAILVLFGFWPALLVDLAALCLAVGLIGSKSAANRANGWLKIGLEAIAFVTTFAMSAQH